MQRWARPGRLSTRQGPSGPRLGWMTRYVSAGQGRDRIEDIRVPRELEVKQRMPVAECEGSS